jgi:hypothetical protein
MEPLEKVRSDLTVDHRDLIKQSSSTAAMHTANKVGVCRQAANGMRAKR